MKFAQFQSTYKPIPTQVYEQTGKELEAKYYQNREQSSLLRQGLANAKVEDRNIGHLAKATTDVEDLLNNVDGKWHYASNVLYNAKDRIVGDKALNASMEDYAKSQSAKQNEQKRFENKEIDQEALNAFYTNEKKYNNKAIALDENGQAINRWATPTAPPKVDTEKKVLEIITLLNQHKDTLDIVYKDNPRLQGFVDQYVTSGKRPEELANAVRGWLRTTPEVKQYYDYINDAKVFSAVTEKDSNDKYLEDANGNFIQKDITAKDFRDLGIPVTDNWITEKNSMIYSGEDGELITKEIKGISPDFKNTPRYKELLKITGSDKLALQQLYKNTLTDLELNEIVDFGKRFAYSETDINTHEDKAFWFNATLRQKKEDDATVFGAYEGIAPLTLQTYDSNAVKSRINDLNTKLQAYSSNDPEYIFLKNQIANERAKDSMLRRSYLATPEGEEVLKNVWESFMKSTDSKLSDYYKKPEIKNTILEYLTGQREELPIGINYVENKTVKSEYNFLSKTWEGASTFKDKNNASVNRSTFDKKFTKAIQEGRFSPTFKTKIFHDKDGKPSPIMIEAANNVMLNGHEWTIPSALNEQGEPMTVGDWYSQAEISSADYYPSIEFGEGTEHVGLDILRFYPKTDKVKPLPEGKDFKIIEPNLENRDNILLNRARLIANSSSEQSIESEIYINNITSGVLFGHYFEPIKNSLAIANSVNSGITFDDFPKQRLSNVPMSHLDPNKTGEFEIVTGIIGNYNGNPIKGFILNQIDPNTNVVSKPGIAIGTKLDDLQGFLHSEYNKK